MPFLAATLNCAHAKNFSLPVSRVMLITAVVFGPALSCSTVWRTSPPQGSNKHLMEDFFDILILRWGRTSVLKNCAQHNFTTATGPCRGIKCLGELVNECKKGKKTKGRKEQRNECMKEKWIEDMKERRNK